MVVASGRRSSPGKRRCAFEPAGLAADGDGALLDAAVALVEIDDGVEAIGGSVVEVALDLGPERRLVGLDREQVVGAGVA